MRAMTVAIAVLTVLCGCDRASPSGVSASPAFTPQGQCEHEGNRWHADSQYCEIQAPKGPGR
jgi:hypothetical protein